MSLAGRREALIAEIKDDISIIAGYYPMAELGEVFENVAAGFQGLGICNLLIANDAGGFSRNLIMSAHTRRYYLNRSAIEGNADYEHLAISRTEAIFCALAAGSDELAQEIVRLSPREWAPDGEYEDDFCYYFFLHNFIERFRLWSSDEAEQILARFERVLGEPSPRVNLCRALASLDQSVFERSLDELILEREANPEPVEDDPAAEARSHVFVEGLGLLRIAERAGFTIENEYKYCPSVLAGVPAPPVPADIYAQLEAQYPR